MGQLGSNLKRLVVLMTDNYYLYLPFIFTKIDIAEGFWCLVVSHIQAWNLYYVLPVDDGRPVLLGESELFVPMELQMGWCKSPPPPFM